MADKKKTPGNRYTVTAHVKTQVVATVSATSALDAFLKVQEQTKGKWPESTYRVVANRAEVQRGQADRVAIPVA